MASPVGGDQDWRLPMTLSADKYLTGSESGSLTSSREVLPFERMNLIAAQSAGEYGRAQPYPHIVVDNFFDDWVLDTVLGEFPPLGDKIWDMHDLPEEVKFQSRHERNIRPFTRQLLYALNSASFLKFLEDLTGIPKLLGDPRFEGGGLHQIPPEGKLAIHVDFNKHSYFDLYRRLNVLVYLNKNWKEDYGGHFELWNNEMTQMAKKVAPIFNRMVVFSTVPNSYHGHPDPLKCPPGMTRKSLALYYYTVNASHGEGTETRHTTLFYKRPGEQFKLKGKQLARDLTPPLIWRMISRAIGS
jgi:hypothetical protein